MNHLLEYQTPEQTSCVTGDKIFIYHFKMSE